MTPEVLTQHFYRQIPISRALGIRVLEISTKHAVLHLPLEPNRNHVQTAFGGSLYAAGALSCYALFQAIAHDAGGISDRLVIQEGTIRYLAPVTQDARVVAELAESSSASNFIKTVKQRKKARLALQAKIYTENLLCASFDGVYVYLPVSEA